MKTLPFWEVKGMNPITGWVHSPHRPRERKIQFEKYHIDKVVDIKKLRNTFVTSRLILKER